MADELLDVQPSEVEFLEELKVGEGNVVFKTRIRSKECVMKVVSDDSPRYHDAFLQLTYCAVLWSTRL